MHIYILCIYIYIYIYCFVHIYLLKCSIQHLCRGYIYQTSTSNDTSFCSILHVFPHTLILAHIYIYIYIYMYIYIYIYIQKDRQIYR